MTFQYGKIPIRLHKCFICSIIKHLTVHHIKPKCKGGKDNLKNLMVLCEEHHKEVEGQGDYKNKRKPETIKKYNDELIKRGLHKWLIK